MPIDDGLDGGFDVVIEGSHGKILFQARSNGLNGSFCVNGLSSIYRKLDSKSIGRPIGKQFVIEF